MDERHARRELDLADGASFLLVEPEAGISPAALAARIEAASTKVRALTRDQLRANDYALALQMGGALIGMLSIIATVVSAFIVVFTAYAFVSARTGELAVAKALGAPQRQLLASAVLQTSIVALIGCAMAVAVIGPMQNVLTALVPDVAVDFSFRTAFRLSAVTIVVAIAAALIPAFYVLKVDPALVFKG
jgi:ABC-type antimicrobial peptide transport system permease subunit